MQRPSIGLRLAAVATGMLMAPKPEVVPTPDILPADARPNEHKGRVGAWERPHKGKAGRQAARRRRQQAAYMGRRNGKTWKARHHG